MHGLKAVEQEKVSGTKLTDATKTVSETISLPKPHGLKTVAPAFTKPTG